MATILPLRLQCGLGSGVPGVDCRVPSVPRTELSPTAGSQSYLEVGHLSERPSSNISTVLFFFFSSPPGTKKVHWRGRLRDQTFLCPELKPHSE